VAEWNDRKIAFGIFVVVLVTCGWFFGGGGWAQNSHFALARAIVEKGTLEISAYRFTTGDVALVDGRLYSNKSPGLSFVAVPPYAAIYALERFAGIDPASPAALTLNLYLLTLLICATSGAGIAALLYMHARERLGTPAPVALGVALTIALATPLLPWSTVFFLHLPNALALLLAHRWAVGSRPVLSGLAAGAAALLNYLCLPLVAVFGLLTIGTAENRRRAAAGFVAGAGAVLAILAAYQLACFGTIFRNPITTNQTFVSDDALFGFVRLPSIAALYGITLSPYRGLFYVAPVLLLAGFGAVRMFRVRELRNEWWAALAVVILFFGFNLTFNNWEGGFGIGPRYVVASIPFLAIWMFFAPRRSIIWIALAVVSFANGFAATAVDPQPSGSIPRPLSQYIYPLLLKGEISPTVPLTPPWSAATIRGHVSVNPHTPDQLKPFMIHPPGSAESEWASFNLGETFFGAGSPWSLLPVILWLAVGVSWLAKQAGGSGKRPPAAAGVELPGAESSRRGGRPTPPPPGSFDHAG
jgi:hypothetical protein